LGERNESESREDEGTVSETARVRDSEQSMEQDNTETETSVSIDIADIEAQVSERLTSIDAQLVATQTIIANAMTSQSVDSYASKNNNIFIQPSIDGGNIDDYIARDYSDARQLYASAQSPYQDSMVQRKEKIDEAVSNRIRAEEHLRRIRGY
jgi:predicted metal-dependent hydrolase